MSPAGYWPQLRAAVEAGADAVYFGLKHFSARAKVGFSLEELPEVTQTLRMRGVRGYLTFNTLVFEHELAQAARTIAAAAEAGVDALIIQDPAIMRLARRIAPGLELHASTQMSIADAEGLRFAQELGADRVTLARELSVTEIGAIYAQTGCDLEVFVHGALCVAYSGQCYSSEAWGGRSANRGQCAQACRLPYEMIVDGEVEPLADARYLLSPGDLYALHQVPELAAAGVGALKIEGRYKDADYVALTTRAYREAVDAVLAGQKVAISTENELALEQVYSRGLGPYFVTGTNHQTVVRGRAPRHRGVLIGQVTCVDGAGVRIKPTEAHVRSPLKPGAGLVFDSADWRSPEEPEEGGRVYTVDGGRRGELILGFANGALRFDRIRPGDLVWRSDDPGLLQLTRPFTEAETPVARRKVDVHVVARAGAALRSIWKCGGRTVETESAYLEASRGRSLDLNGLKLQLARLGDTPYQLGVLTVDTLGDPFVPASMLNQMRREAIAQLQALEGETPVIEILDTAAALASMKPAPLAQAEGAPQLHLLVRTPQQLDAALMLAPASITLDYLDLYGLRPSVERVRTVGFTVRVASPRIFKPGEAKIMNFLVSLGCPILVRSTGLLHALQKVEHPELIGDFSLNTANSPSAQIYFDQGISRLTPGHDLNAAQVASLAGVAGGARLEVIAYQHLPVFHTEHCVFCRFLSKGTSYKDCGRPCEKHLVELRDKAGRQHPVMADVGCRNTVFGAEAQEASLHLDSWREAGIQHFRLEFAHESAGEVTEVAGLFSGALNGKISAAELGKKLKKAAPGGTTQGSLFVATDYQVLPILQ
jgi:putative protease